LGPFVFMASGIRMNIKQQIGSVSGFPQLCDPEIVADTCATLNRQTDEVFNTSADADLTILHATELSEHLMISVRTVRDFLKKIIRVDNEEETQAALEVGAYAIKCDELCARIVEIIPANYRPSASDQACYIPADSDTAVCDIDVSDDAFSRVIFPDHNEEQGATQYGENRNQNHSYFATEMELEGEDGEDSIVEDVSYRPDIRPVSSYYGRMMAWLDVNLYTDATFDELTIAVANLFRIYPPPHIGVVDSQEDDIPESSNINHVVEKKEREANACYRAVDGAEFRNASFFHWNVKCKCHSSECIFGDTQACTDAVRRSVDVCRKFDPDELSKPQWAQCNLQCRSRDWKHPTEPSSPAKPNVPPVKPIVPPAPSNTHCVDKQVTGYQTRTGKPLSCYQLRRHCREEQQIRDACPKTCGLTCAEPPKPKPGTWQADVAKIGVKAQAYTAKAIRNMGAHKVPHVVKTWFGDNSEKTRKVIRRILNGVDRMLMNVEYRYPGEECSPNTYAYVYPYAPRNMNRRGQYIYHLCKFYMTRDEGEQIETLTHEGSHHEMMYTDDVCYRGSGSDCHTAYGRGTCMRLAQKDTSKALKNADNYCYFINDASR